MEILNKELIVIKVKDIFFLLSVTTIIALAFEGDLNKTLVVTPLISAPSSMLSTNGTIWCIVMDLIYRAMSSR